MEPCTYCKETHTNWWEECEASFIASQLAMQRPKPVEPEPTTYQPACWIHPYAVKRIKDNNGLLAKCAFNERLSHSCNDAQSLPLYPPLPQSLMVVKREDMEALIMLLDPEPLLNAEGQTLVFNNPMAAEVLRELSARVRAMRDNARGLVVL